MKLKDTRKRLMVALNLDEKQKAALSKIAEEECRSMTQHIEHLIKREVKKFEGILSPLSLRSKARRSQGRNHFPEAGKMVRRRLTCEKY